MEYIYTCVPAIASDDMSSTARADFGDMGIVQKDWILLLIQGAVFVIKARLVATKHIYMYCVSVSIYNLFHRLRNVASLFFHKSRFSLTLHVTQSPCFVRSLIYVFSTCVLLKYLLRFVLIA